MIRYSGGPNVDLTYVSNGTAQPLINWVEDSMNSAGWTTTSGHHSTSILLRSGTTPNSNAISMLLTISGTLAVFTLRNAAGTLVGAAGNIQATTGFTYRIAAGPYQAFLWVPGTVAARTALAFGVPYVPPFMAATAVGDLGWFVPDAWGDGRSGVGFRGTFNLEASGVPQYAMIGNNSVLSSAGSQVPAAPKLIALQASATFTATVQAKFADGSFLMTEPYISFGLTSLADVSTIRGQLWDAVILHQPQAADATFALDGHTFAAYTLGYAQASLLVLSS